MSVVDVAGGQRQAAGTVAVLLVRLAAPAYGVDVEGAAVCALAAFLGPSLTNAMIAIGVTATPIFVRLTRGQTLAANFGLGRLPHGTSFLEAL